MYAPTIARARGKVQAKSRGPEEGSDAGSYGPCRVQPCSLSVCCASWQDVGVPVINPRRIQAGAEDPAKEQRRLGGCNNAQSRGLPGRGPLDLTFPGAALTKAARDSTVPQKCTECALHCVSSLPIGGFLDCT